MFSHRQETARHPGAALLRNQKGIKMRTNNQRRNGIIAAVLGAALLMGGGTYALWSASAGLKGATITAGDLDITAKDTSYMYDVSDDVVVAAGDAAETIAFGSQDLGTVQGLPIDDTFLIVPGDTIALVYGYDIVLEGDNIQAELSMDVAASIGEFDPENLTFGYELYGPDGTLLDSAVDLAETDGPLYTFTEPTTDTVYLVLLVTFNGDTPERDDATHVADLSDAITVSLDQVRDF